MLVLFECCVPYLWPNSLKFVRFVVQHCEAFVGGCISIKHEGDVAPLPAHVIEINQRCVQSVGQTQQTLLRHQYINKTQKIQTQRIHKFIQDLWIKHGKWRQNKYMWMDLMNDLLIKYTAIHKTLKTNATACTCHNKSWRKTSKEKWWKFYYKITRVKIFGKCLIPQTTPFLVDFADVWWKYAWY